MTLVQRLSQAIRAHGGCLPFDAFMGMALYEPGLGYYSSHRTTFGLMPGGQGGGAGASVGSDFVTAPELSPLFGQTLARQVRQALHATGTQEVWEFGAGSGALAFQILKQCSEWEQATGVEIIQKYTIVDVSGSLRQRQQDTLAAFGDRVQWADRLPATMRGVVLGNEVLDAMPVKLLARVDGQWMERGVALAGDGASVPNPDTSADTSPDNKADAPADIPTDSTAFVWADQPTELRPPVEVDGDGDYVTEIHPQAEAFMRTLADHLVQGAAFLIDYGFPEAEYFHPQRSMGTLVCHHLHRMDDNPLVLVGEKDITAHVNFTGVALAAQDAGLEVLGYTSQARFLINAGLAEVLQALPDDDAGLAARTMAAKLIHEHEMGELFKVLAVAPAASASGWAPVGFTAGDRTHTL
jgi:SAM-dependent MidA family methyltransferase